MSEKTELLPCPFCGSDRVTVWNIRDGMEAVCKDCKSRGTSTFHGPGLKDNPNDTWERAVAAWNTRPAPAVAVKPLEWWSPSERNNQTHGAKTIFGTYYVGICGGRHNAWIELFHESGDIEQWEGETRGSLIEAQMDAQRHYQTRILSALSPQPPLSPQEAAKVLLEWSGENMAPAAKGPFVMAYLSCGEAPDPNGLHKGWIAALRAIAGGGDHE